MRERSGKFKHKHSLGQNFIVDEFIFDDIVSESGITKDDLVLEIGPGNGAMTRVLCENAKFVVAVEVDKTLMPLLKDNLKDYNNVTVINADFLSCDFETILSEFEKGLVKLALMEEGLPIQNIRVVANIPYYITSPIIMALLMNFYVSEITLMVQKEVAERIIAVKGNKDYGVLTLACQYFAETEGLFLVPRTSFYPVPKVDSAVVKFIKRPEFVKGQAERTNITEDENYKRLFKLIKAAFQERRKKLVNSLNNVLGIDKLKINTILKDLGFDENARAEELSLDDYMRLVEELGNV